MRLYRLAAVLEVWRKKARLSPGFLFCTHGVLFAAIVDHGVGKSKRVGLCLALGFAQLGRWQLSREGIKRQQLAAADAALAGPARGLAEALARPEGIDKVVGRARFTATPRLWLDNQRRGQQVGMRLYCAAAPVDGGTPLLVDLGWLPVAPDRALPAVGCPEGEHALAGLLVAPPSVGLRLGPGLVEQDGAWLATRLDPAEVSAAWASDPALAALAAGTAAAAAADARRAGADDRCAER